MSDRRARGWAGVWPVVVGLSCGGGERRASSAPEPLVEVADPVCAPGEVALGPSCESRDRREVYDFEMWGEVVLQPHEVGGRGWWYSPTLVAAPSARWACEGVGGTLWAPVSREDFGVAMHFSALSAAARGTRGASVWLRSVVDPDTSVIRVGDDVIVNWVAGQPPMPGSPDDPSEREVLDDIEISRDGGEPQRRYECLAAQKDGAVYVQDCFSPFGAVLCAVP